MNFEIDVLILFADADDKPADKNNTGWVSQFKRFLELMLTQVLGEKPNILLKGEFDALTAPNLDQVATVATVLSNDFIQSGQCLDHLESFYQQVKNQPAIQRQRVFKVFKSPLSVQQQPPRLREQIGYEMYQLDAESGEVREYTDYFSTEAERQYWMKMVDLAYDIYDTLLALTGEASSAEVKTLYRRKTIYVAETGHDLAVQRNIIKRELQRHGYVVLPRHTLPGRLHDLEQTVLKDLQASDLSIHLIGAAYGEIPLGADNSVVDIQNRLAAEKSLQAREQNNTFSRLIWISPNLANASEKQRSFIEKIKRDTEAQEGAEILQTPLEDFKNIMREELLDDGDPVVLSEESRRCVYLVHDRSDQQAIQPITELIQSSGFSVLVPDFDGELLELRKKHINNLKYFDVAVIYNGHVNEQWVRMKVLDLLKAPGFGRKKPVIGKAVIFAPGTSADLDDFKNQQLHIIQGDQQASLESLKTYLQEFNR